MEDAGSQCEVAITGLHVSKSAVITQRELLLGSARPSFRAGRVMRDEKQLRSYNER